MEITAVSDILNAAKVPDTLKPQTFGDWQIRRLNLPLYQHHFYGRTKYTALIKYVKSANEEHVWAKMHLARDDGAIPDVVMDDSPQELKQHLPIWMNAKGHVLKTGLGLGCVVRGLLTIPEVTKISVIEIDKDIIDIVGAEFAGNNKVEIHHGDALSFDLNLLDDVDYAWHDIWVPENEGLQLEHGKLLLKYKDKCATQGAWKFPRDMKRLASQKMALIG